MASARFVYDNEVTKAGVTIAASSAASGYPAAYLSNRARWKPWRSGTSTGDQTVTVTFPTSKTVKAIAVVNYLAHVGGSIKAEYWTGAAWANFAGGTGLFTLPASNRTKVVVLWDTTGVSTTQIRITFTNTGAVSAYVELGALVAGSYFSPTVNLTDDVRFDYIDPSALIAADNGQEIARKRTKYLGLNTSYQYLAATDATAFMTMFDTVGCTEPLLYAVDPADVDQIVYGRFVETLPKQHLVLNQWQIDAPFVEVR